MIEHIGSRNISLSNKLVLKDFQMVGSPELSTAWLVYSSVEYVRTFHFRGTKDSNFLVKFNKIFQGSRKDATL